MGITISIVVMGLVIQVVHHMREGFIMVTLRASEMRKICSGREKRLQRQHQCKQND